MEQASIRGKRIQQSEKYSQVTKLEATNQRLQRGDHNEEDESEEEQVVLKIDGTDQTAIPYYLQGFIKSNRFRALRNSNSPFILSAKDEMKKIIQNKDLHVRLMIKGAKC